MVYTTKYVSPLGDILLAERNNALIGLWFTGQKYFLSSLREELTPCDDRPVFRQTKQWLSRYFAGEKPSAEGLLIAPAGSEFQQAVWRLLRKIPCGETTSYGKLAKTIAAERGLASMSAQAVGGAVGHNPISIIIPCHRVVGTDGSLTGYAGGVDKKIRLLALEGVEVRNGIVAGRRNTEGHI